MENLADIESVHPHKVFEANPGFPWTLLFKVLVGVLLFVNLCTLAIFSLQTPELFLPPNQKLLDDMVPFPPRGVPSSFPENILQSEVVPATCEAMVYSLVYDYVIKACNDDGFWEDFTKLDPGTLYVLGSVLSVILTFVFVYIYYRFPGMLIWIAIFAIVIFIAFLAVVVRNNSPSRGADALSVLHRFVTSDVTFVEYRALLGLGTLMGSTLSKQAYAIEPSPIFFDKLRQLVEGNDLTAGVELSNHCISHLPTEQFSVDPEDVDRNKYKSDVTSVNVTCVTLPDFITYNKIQPPLFISFESEGSLSIVASWRSWIEQMESSTATKPVLYVSINTSEDDYSNELKQEVCDVLNSYDLLFIEHPSYRHEPLTPNTLCSSCRYLVMDKEMADYYQLNTQAHDHIPEGGDHSNHPPHGSHA